MTHTVGQTGRQQEIIADLGEYCHSYSKTLRGIGTHLRHRDAVGTRAGTVRKPVGEHTDAGRHPQVKGRAFGSLRRVARTDSRAAFQEGAVQLNELWGRAALRQLRRRGVSEPQVIQEVVDWIRRAHLRFILEAEPWQPPGRLRKPPLPSPHILAQATMQTSGRDCPRGAR